MALERRRLLKPAKNLRKLVKEIDERPSPDAVHDLRTNVRCFEAALEVLSLKRRGLSKSVLQKLSRCRKTAGRVRDMDVLIIDASTIQLTGEEECALQLLEHLRARRRKEAKKLHAELGRIGPQLRKELKRTPALVKKAIQDHNEISDQTGLVPHAVAAAVNLLIQLATPSGLGRQNLHRFRLRVKELSNVLQMAAAPSHPRFVDELRKVKDAIGEWHDWEELVSIAQKALDHGTKCGMLAELKNNAKRKYQHALSLAETLRKKCRLSTRPPKPAASSATPKGPIWQAIATLAA
jgi:CHAD domain-containing protein